MKKDFVSELPPLILPNTGNMGIPICLFAYGTEGLGIASAIASVIILLHFTLGVLLAKKFSLKILITNMPIYGIIAAVIVLYYDWQVPGFVVNTVLLTYATIFLVLMSSDRINKIKSIMVECIHIKRRKIIIGPDWIWFN